MCLEGPPQSHRRRVASRLGLELRRLARGTVVYSTAPLIWGTGVTTAAHKTAAYAALAAMTLVAAAPA